jgi:hypothetical protein
MPLSTEAAIVVKMDHKKPVPKSSAFRLIYYCSANQRDPQLDP